MRYAITDGNVRIAWANLNPVFMQQGDALITLVHGQNQQ
jgi:hypothetical protein